MAINSLPTNEKPIANRLFVCSFILATSYIASRTVGDSLFLSRVGNDQLALVFIFAGCATALAAGCWYWLTRQISISKSIQLSGLVFATLSIWAWVLLPTYHHSFWLLAGIYLLAEIRGCINAINVVSALNVKLGAEASTASWAYVGLAAPLAGVLIGLALAVESSVLSLRTWLLIGALLDFASFSSGLSLQKIKRLKSKKPVAMLGVKSAKKSLKVYVRSDKFRWWIGILISAKVTVMTLVSFEWKTIVNDFFAGDAESLVQFFGYYYGVIGLATVATQYFFAKHLLTRRSLKLPILLMPILLLLMSVPLLFGVGLMLGVIVATLGKSLEVWRRSVHDTTLNTLYTRIRRNQRRSVIAFNSAIVKPTAEVLTACVIFFSTAMVYRPLMLVVIVVWIVAGIRLIRLVGSIQKARAEDSNIRDSTAPIVDKS